jgi:hypothetical protein
VFDKSIGVVAKFFEGVCACMCGCVVRALTSFFLNIMIHNSPVCSKKKIEQYVGHLGVTG